MQTETGLDKASQTVSTAAVKPVELPRRPWVAIAGNPFSGSGKNALHVARLEQFLNRHGVATRVLWDRDERARVAQHPDFSRHCLCIVAAGGDGTVSSVINLTCAAPLAVLPLGTENLVAKHLNFINGPEALGQAILNGKTRAVDLGRLGNGMLFSLMVSCGADAAVVHKLQEWRTNTSDGTLRRVRRASYVRPALHAMWTYPFPRVSLEADGHTHEGALAMVYCIPRYALNLPFAPDGRDDDGKFDWVVFRDGGCVQSFGYLLSVFRGAHRERSDVVWGSSSVVRVSSPSNPPVQVDGDPHGTTPVDLSIVPGAIRVIVA